MRRFAVVVALVLAGGLVINVLVAWGCALWVDVFRGEVVVTGDTPRGLVAALRVSRAGAVYYETVWGPSAPYAAPNDALALDEVIPAWTGLARPGAAPMSHRAVDVRGWPFRSMWSEYGVQAPSGVRGALVLPTSFRLGHDVLSGRTRYGRTLPKVLPLHPRWPQLAANSLLYAGSLGLLLAAALGVRRRIRQSGGRCVTCGYDLRGSGGDSCPECGHAAVQGEPVGLPRIQQRHSSCAARSCS